MQYPVEVTREGRYTLAEFPDCPGCQTFVNEGESIEEAAQEALEGWLESHLGRDLVPPRPGFRYRTKGQSESAIPVNPLLAVRIQVRWAREDAELTQAQLSKLLGMSQQQVAKLESKNANPTVATLAKVAESLGRRVVVKLEPVDAQRRRSYQTYTLKTSVKSAGLLRESSSLSKSTKGGSVTRGKGKDVHTVRNVDGAGWVNKVKGEVVSKHRTQENAAEKGRTIAKHQHSEHVIHGRDGRIREKNSYGNDPNPPKDKR